MNFEHDFNPYSSPAEACEPPPAPQSAASLVQQRSWLGSLAIWSLVCSISAAPSFYLGALESHQALAMLAGISLFIAGYTVADQRTQGAAWRRNEKVRRTLKIGYVTRMLASIISIVAPVGLVLDMYCGIVSVGLVGIVFPEVHSGYVQSSVGFLPTLLTTLVQGAVLNVVLAGYMVVVFLVLLISVRNQDDEDLAAAAEVWVTVRP